MAPKNLRASVKQRLLDLSRERGLDFNLILTRYGALLTRARASDGGHRAEGLVRTSHPGDAVVEDAAIEITVDGRLHAAAQVAMLLLDLLLVDEQEALEVMRKGPVEDRALGME